MPNWVSDEELADVPPEGWAEEQQRLQHEREMAEERRRLRRSRGPYPDTDWDDEYYPIELGDTF